MDAALKPEKLRNDFAQVVRRIMRPWHRVTIPDADPTHDGLAEISRVILMLVIRNEMFACAAKSAGLTRS